MAAAMDHREAVDALYDAADVPDGLWQRLAADHRLACQALSICRRSAG